MTIVLVIDDSAFQRTILSSILKNEGYEVIQAQNGREGLDRVRADNPDVVILDILMPEMNGIEVLAEIRTIRPDLPVVMSSADIQKTTHEECLSKGAKVFLTKPIHKKDLVEAVLKALSKS